MSGERATLRPVNLARLVEVIGACDGEKTTPEELASSLESTERRAKEVAAEAERIGLLERREGEEEQYTAAPLGQELLEAVEDAEWLDVSRLLAANSPHYAILREAIVEMDSATVEELTEQLSDHPGLYKFNQTGIEVICDWGERLGDFQRHAFTGRYYVVDWHQEIDSSFGDILLKEYENLDQTTGLNVQQGFVSLPQLREHLCERLRCPRDAFDDALVELLDQNIGKLELAGAPRDTQAKDSALGIKDIEVSAAGGLVTTIQSTDRILRGVEYRNKQYFYFADQRPDHPLSAREGRSR